MRDQPGWERGLRHPRRDTPEPEESLRESLSAKNAPSQQAEAIGGFFPTSLMFVLLIGLYCAALGVSYSLLVSRTEPSAFAIPLFRERGGSLLVLAPHVIPWFTPILLAASTVAVGYCIAGSLQGPQVAKMGKKRRWNRRGAVLSTLQLSAYYLLLFYFMFIWPVPRDWHTSYISRGFLLFLTVPGAALSGFIMGYTAGAVLLEIVTLLRVELSFMKRTFGSRALSDEGPLHDQDSNP